MTTHEQGDTSLETQSPPKQRFFVFVRSKPGKTYRVGIEIARKKKHIVREVSSTSGEWDLLLLLEASVGVDIGYEVAKLFEEIEGIESTNTIGAYRINA